MAKRESVSLQDARRVIAAAENKAHEIGQPCNIAVVDAGGSLVAHVRMDGAWTGSVEVSINKALTSRVFDISTAELAANEALSVQIFGVHAPTGERLELFAGGIPLRRCGSVVGAVGVSGGCGEYDQSIAETAAAALDSFQPVKEGSRG